MVWASTAEKSFWEKLGKFIRSFGLSERQLCTKTPARSKWQAPDPYWWFVKTDAFFCLELEASCLQLMSFFAWNWFGERFCLQSEFIHLHSVWAFLHAIKAVFAHNGILCLSTYTDCKQRNSTVSRKSSNIGGVLNGDSLNGTCSKQRQTAKTATNSEQQKKQKINEKLRTSQKHENTQKTKKTQKKKNCKNLPAISPFFEHVPQSSLWHLSQ